MSLVEEILRELWNTSLSYKGAKVNLFGIPKFKSYSYGSMRSTLSRLHKKGVINMGDKGWYLTPAGKRYIKRKENSLQQFGHNFTKETPKNLMVMFDVPETKKAEREWLRWHLKKFNYEMIQKSVWVGPSPLPKEFMDYVSKIKLKESIKTFKLTKSYNISR
ncbi:MAG: hypothetical protein AAB868_00280 [Patescibacteria group bacterium]